LDISRKPADEASVEKIEQSVRNGEEEWEEEIEKYVEAAGAFGAGV
jgi:hypothetical protein